MPAKPRTGRTPGSPDNRQAILDAAGAQFAELGYDRATIRGIARAAGVDPALVYHYFGSKHRLFADTMELPVSPADILPDVLAGDRETVAWRLLTAVLGVWEEALPGQSRVAAVLRSSVTHEQSAAMLREFLTSQVLGRLTRALGDDRPELRASLAASQMVGLAMSRYVLKIEPLASAAPEELVPLYAPVVQHYLTGPLGELPSRARHTEPVS
ncbi:TetR/AcrR family transcriptional regulator [Allostreptomyces psammosilenae]|uniref:AcrR family transcriptional regulator n=1 Tax=Allostreptomyces psammosilenae TaxID=1892865 RepID=A0A852ZVQ3_9ACTN|nr:TetR family transcriptional regulator [Allostreptomyces psammosilenae]NYI06473.1 AcrR family transcriptional regulator [Allostreptomyces psammosilenae]